MRRVVGILLMVIALACLLAGAALATLLGPDNRAITGPHPLSFDGVAVVTAPDVLSWAGPRVTVLVELPDRTPVFVGLGNAVDVEDYLRDIRALRIDSYEVPWTVTTTEVPGGDLVPASPLAMDWWLARSAGQGGAAVTFTLPDQTVSLAIVAIGDATLQGLQVTASYDVRGGFGIGLGLVGLGIGLGVFGWIAFRRASRPADWDDDMDDKWDDDWDDEWDGERRGDPDASAPATVTVREGGGP